MSERPKPFEARAIAQRLRHAMVTMQNDDLSPPRTEKRSRHIARIDVLLDAAEFLEGLGRDTVSACPAVR
jgi:hypothetical protein